MPQSAIVRRLRKHHREDSKTGYEKVEGAVPDLPVPSKPTSSAFQNAILTYDAKNPQPWQVERANVGRDYAATFPEALR
jgi:hypothetical protein